MSPAPHSQPELSVVTSEMGSRVRDFDWASTPLGPIADWPQSLRIAVGICLNSRFPMFVWWGEHLINIYNDGYIPMLGARHPGALGQPAEKIWGEIWGVVGAEAEKVMQRGEATFNERVLLMLERYGYPEETYFTWSYSPIPGDEGKVGGLFCAVTEETARVFGERDRVRLLAQVESERARLAEAFAQAPSFLAIMRGPQHVFEFVNARYHDLIGERELIGLPVREAVPEIAGQGFFEIIDRVYATGEPFVGTSVKVKVRRHQGGALENVYIDFVYQPMRAPDGSVIGILAHGVDVTDRQRAEMRDRFLLELEEAIRAVTEPLELTARAAEMLGKQLDADRCAYGLVDVDQDSFHVVGDYVRGVSSVVGRYRFSDYGEEIVHLMRADQPFVVKDVQHHQPPLEDPAYYERAQVGAFVCVPLHKAGRFVAMMAVHVRGPRDWTPDEVELVRQVANRCWESIQRIRVEESLREGERSFRQLADERKRIADALEAEKVILEMIASGSSMNAVLERIVRGVEAQSAMGMMCSVLLVDDAGERLLYGAAPSLPAAYNEAIHGVAIGPAVGSCGTAAYEGREVVVEDVLASPLWTDYRDLATANGLRACTSTPIFGADGRVLGTVAAYYREPHLPVDHERDLIRSATHLAGIVLEKHRVDQRLRQSLEAEQFARGEAERASRMKDEFLATLSHELRTPLNAILGWSHMLRRPEASPREIHQGAEVIERNARAQATIIEDLLDMSAIISGKVRLQMQPLDIAAIARSSVDTARPAGEAKHVRIESQIDPMEGVVLSGDPNRLQQVLWNLLTNAIKFTPRDGRVTVKLHRSESHVELSVSDTGEGIPPEFVPFIFDRFRQADASTTRRHGGLGLGLSIVKQLVELHGGTVRAQSAGTGRGATFTVSLPIQGVAPAAESELDNAMRLTRRIAIASDEGKAIAGRHVLVVDDDADARELVCRLLEEYGARVKTADCAAEALALLREHRFDALISDIGMPGEDGHALMRKVRALPADANGDIPAMALTAYARPEDRVKAIRAGFQMHAAKPIEPAELIAMLASLLRHRVASA